MNRRCLAPAICVLCLELGCGSGTTGVPCSTDPECPAGQQCVGGSCVPRSEAGTRDGLADRALADAGLDRPAGDQPRLDAPLPDAPANPELGKPDLPVDLSPAPDAPLDAPAPDLLLPDLLAPDLVPPDLLAPDTCPKPCSGVCCQASENCVPGFCYTPIGSCTTHDDCRNDSYCHGGQCVPYGIGPFGIFNANCLRTIPAGQFSPALQCEWSGPPAGDAYPNHKNVLGTPVVVDFQNQAEGAPPSIVFVSYDRLDGGGEAARCDSGAFGVIRVIRGTDCHQLQTIAGIQVRASSPLAVGDLDGDKRAEIVAYRCGGGVVAIRWDTPQQKFVQHWVSNPATLGSSELLWSGPSLHDLDNDGKPEVLMGGIVFNHLGQALDTALGTLTPAGHPGGFAVVGDIDNDGKIELVNGQNVWEWNATTKKWTVQSTSANTTGLVALADFGTFGASAAQDDRSKLDGIAEVAVVRSGSVVVQTLAGRVVFGPVNLPGGGAGGPPTVGDFDKDGRVELACAGYGAYTVFDPDCKTGGTAAICPSLRSDGILWTQPSKDHSSSSTGSSIFDFEGNGSAEAIYADECFARVYQGSTGEVLFSQYHTSCTWYENPVVADVDLDFQSELVVPSNTNCGKFAECTAAYAKAPSGKAMDPLFKGFRCTTTNDCPGGTCNSGFCRCTGNAQCGTLGSYECAAPVTGTPGSGNVCRSVIPAAATGVRVYRDVQDRWVDSRPIWNQHAYSVTNVEDNGVIPTTASWTKNWTTPGMNNYRQNQQGALNPSTVPDLTSNLSQGVSCSGGGMVVQSQVCNRGTKAVGAGVHVAVYKGNPKAGGTLGCTTSTKKILPIGLCETVTCTITPAPTAALDLYVVADDDGTGKTFYVECYDQNNWAILKAVSCP
jgi:hypothetical protein